MRTIASTVGTREEAEIASRRLQALGIDPERIMLRDMDEAAGEGPGGVLISVKVPPEHAAAATAILKGGAGDKPHSAAPDNGASEPTSSRGQPQAPAPSAPASRTEAVPSSAAAVTHASEGFWVEEGGTSANSASPVDRGANAAAAARTERAQPAVERAPDAPLIQTRVGPAKEGGLAKRREESGGFSRLFVIAVMLAALGMALGALLGSLV